MATSDPVKVGVDGSKASIRAALWAADEAMARDARLDLVYVVDPSRIDDVDAAMTAARHALHRAWEAVSDSGKHVKLETEILQGDPAIELADAARHASLICVGHKGTNDSSSLPRGATSEAVVRMAPVTAAVVRRRHKRPPTCHRWIVVVLDESAESVPVLQAALDEAALRKAPVLALTSWSTSSPRGSADLPPVDDVRATVDRHLRDTLDGTAAVRVCALPMPDDVTTILQQSAGIDQLLVIGAGRTDVIEQLQEQRARDALRKTNCSILIVRAPMSVERRAFASATARVDEKQ